MFPAMDEMDREPPAFVIFVDPSVKEDRVGDGVKLCRERLEVCIELLATNEFVLTEGVVACTPMILKYPGTFRMACVGLKTMLLMTFMETPVVSGVTMLLALMNFSDTTVLAILTDPLKDAVLMLLR